MLDDMTLEEVLPRELVDFGAEHEVLEVGQGLDLAVVEDSVSRAQREVVQDSLLASKLPSCHSSRGKNCSASTTPAMGRKTNTAPAPPALSKKTEMSASERVAAARSAAMRRDRDQASKTKMTSSRIPVVRK